MGEMDPDLVGPAGLQPAGQQAGDRLCRRRRRSASAPPNGSRPRGRPRGPPSCRGRADAGRSAGRWCLGAGRARPRRRPGSRVAAGRCGRGRRTGRPAPGVRGRSWRPPSARWCPCRGDARYPGRRTPPMPERLAPQWAIERVDQRAGPVAGGGMDDQAARACRSR